LWPEWPASNKLYDTQATSAVQRGKHITYLTGKLACRHQHYCLNMANVRVNTLDDGKPESDSLTGAGA
jgi:hypothetical protein